MKKSEILALIEDCAQKFEGRIIQHPEQKEKIQKYLEAVVKDFNYVSDLSEDSDELTKYADAYKDLYFHLTKKEYKTRDEIVNEIISDINSEINSESASVTEEHTAEEPIVKPVRKKVKKVKTTEEQTEEEKELVKKSKGRLKKFGIALLIIALLGTGHHIGKSINQRNTLIDEIDTVNTIEYTESTTTEAFPIIDINLDNYEELLTYATELQNELPEDNRPSIDDIMYAIRLANFDLLEDKSVFKERDEVCYSSLVSGYLIQNLSSDNIIQRDEESDINISETDLQSSLICVTDNKLNISCFIDAKNEKGYDIYKVCEICSKNLNNESYAFEYAKVFNDIMARYLRDCTICENSPISTSYTIVGLYNVCLPRILELTAGQNLGPIYGSNYRIDGTYGHICIEELANVFYISTEKGEAVGNPENALFTDIIDYVILQKEPTR